MTVRVEDLTSGRGPEPAHQSRSWIRIAAVVGFAVMLVVAGLVIGFGGGLFHPLGSRALPSFPSLTEHPDSSLHGTVAYFANDTGCVRIAAASGEGSKDVLCISGQDLAVKPEQGVKPAGPQLVWLSGDRLEVTMFLWKPAPGPLVYTPGWQKIVDIKTGAVTNVPTALVPSTPTYTTEAVVNANGDKVAYSLDGPSGRVEVTLTDNTGQTRTLLSARGPGEYTYQFGPVFWAPNGKWIAASDADRILIITAGIPAQTRVLVTGSGAGAGGGTAGPAFAVTASDLLTAQ